MKTWKYLWNDSLQRRVSVLTAIVVALAVIVFSLVGYLMIRTTLVNDSQDVAVSTANDLAGAAAQDIRTTGALSEDLHQAGGVVVEAVGFGGQVLRTPGEHRELVLEPGDLAAVEADGPTIRRTGVSADGQPFVIVAVPLPGTGYALLIGSSLIPAMTSLEVQRRVLLALSAAGVLAAALAGILVGRSGLRPVRQLTEAVEHVTATQDLQPVSVHHARGALATLAAAFNLMLVSLITERNRRSGLVADAGHELRTPLTSLRMNVDLLAADLSRDKLSLDQKSAVLSDVQGELGALTEMIGDLVHVAREDTAHVLVPLDVRDVVESSLERVGRRAQGATFDVELDPLFVVANPEALGRAVTNLLDNAVKWSPAGGNIRVRLEGNRLRVSDAGPGIAEADLPYVFDRFFRGESARRTRGTGLGLAIVAKTVGEMGGTVQAGRSTEGGAELTLQLPGVTSREALADLLVPTSGPFPAQGVVGYQPVSSNELTITAQPAVRTRATAASQRRRTSARPA